MRAKFFSILFVWRFFLGGGRGRGMEKEFNHQNAGAKKSPSRILRTGKGVCNDEGGDTEKSWDLTFRPN